MGGKTQRERTEQRDWKPDGHGKFGLTANERE
jgi:hypothetical protein